MIDLHAHTTASDGSYTPVELVRLARESGVTVLGITDHDTTDGLAEARLEAAETGDVEIVPGVELSCEYAPGTMHLLGYFIDETHEALRAMLQAMRDRRDTRNPKIVAALQRAGFALTMEEVLAEAGGNSIGRPHIAQAMIRKGYISSVDEAFAQWLDRGRPAYVPQARLEPAEAIATVHAAGGVAVLAHPYQLKPRSPEHLEEIVQRLCGYGLRGIEVWYSRHTPEMTQSYLALAERYGLTPTGGSDFHGVPKPAIRLGTGTGDLSVPPETLGRLRTRALARS